MIIHPTVVFMRKTVLRTMTTAHILWTNQSTLVNAYVMKLSYEEEHSLEAMETKRQFESQNACRPKA